MLCTLHDRLKWFSIVVWVIPIPLKELRKNIIVKSNSSNDCDEQFVSVYMHLHNM